MFRHPHKSTKGETLRQAQGAPTMKNRSGQNTAEYALLIALVVAGVIAMQTYMQRSLQAKTRDTNQYLIANSVFIAGKDVDQYEPSYQNSDYAVTRDAEENKRLGKGLVGMDSSTNRERRGFQESTYTPPGS